MNREIVLTVFVVAILFSSLCGTLFIRPILASTTHHVYPGQLIQKAINSAKSGDTIFVHEGTYYEHLVVNKTVLLIGERKETTIIDGDGTGTVVTVTANSVNISSLTIQNGYGIEIRYSNDHIIADNIVSSNDYGIRLSLSHNNKICNNLIASNTHTGIETRESSRNIITNNTIRKNGFNIWLYQSDDNNIIGNTASDGDWGIILYCSSNNTLRDNMMTGNRYNLGVWGDLIADFVHDIDTSNSVNEKKVYYLVNERNRTIDSSTFPDVGYLGIVNSANIHVKDLTLAGNSEGVLFAHTTDSTIENVHASSNSAGISIKCGSHYNTIRNNLITRSEMVGIYLHDSSNNSINSNQIETLNNGIHMVRSKNNMICGNDLERARVGLYIIEDSYSNLIYHNIIKQVNVGFSLINIWDNGYPSGGNYWSYYTGVDLYSGPYQNETGSDGIGDTSYVIDENNKDWYPLMEPLKRVSGKLEILEPVNGSTIAGPVAITFTIKNTGDLIEFIQGDPSNRIDLEIEYRSTDGETCGWGIIFWSTSYYGLTIRSWEKHEQTLIYDPSEYEEAAPPDFVGDAPYGQTTIRLVHWKQMDDGYSYGEFGVIEIKVTITFLGDSNLDGKVDIRDIAIAALSFGSYPDHPRWNPIADVNQDNKVDIRDISLIARNFGKTL